MDNDTAIADAATTCAAAPVSADDAAKLPDELGAWLHRVAAEPFRHDFYRVLRRFEAAFPQLPRLGEAVRPADEPLRVAQPAELSFAPASIHALVLRAGAAPLLQQRIFGLLGPNGPLPLHLTELARERAHHHGDATLQRFLDFLTHRFALLFYRSWAQAQPALALDRPGQARFERRLGALAGLGLPGLLARDALGDATKLHFVGRLSMQVRNAEGLLAICEGQFDVPVFIEQWRGHWMPLARDERSRLGTRAGAGLGSGAVLGASVWDVQHRFRIVIGPLSLARYVDFLPGGRDLARLQAIVRQWVGLEFAWDLTLVLSRAEVPPLRLGRPGPAGRLGRTGWLGRYTRGGDARDMTIDVESTLRPRRRALQRDMQEERP
jgi:type VI secretion system protein ImpH